MKIKDYERNKRIIELGSNRQKETVCSSSGTIAKRVVNVEKGTADTIGRLIQMILNELFVQGYLPNEIKVSVPDDYELHGFAIHFRVLK